MKTVFIPFVFFALFFVAACEEANEVQKIEMNAYNFCIKKVYNSTIYLLKDYASRGESLHTDWVLENHKERMNTCHAWARLERDKYKNTGIKHDYNSDQ